MLAICNEGCKKQFEIKQLKERKLKDGIRETYFKCSECDKKYICFYTDREIRQLKARLREKYGKATREEIEELQAKVKVKMDDLKEKMGNAAT